MENNVNVIDYGFFNHDGLDFEYHVSGNSDGKPLVMLNGNGGDYRCFEGDLYKPLSEYFKIIRFSTRGTGKTPLGDNLIQVSVKLKEYDEDKREEPLKILAENSSATVMPYVESIEDINRYYNEPMDVMFDKEYIYIPA